MADKPKIPRGFHKSVFDNAGVPMLSIDGEGRIVRVNAAFASLTGSTHDDLEGQPAADWVVGPERQPLDPSTDHSALVSIDGSPTLHVVRATRLGKTGTGLHLVCLLPADRGDDDDGRLEAALQKERERTLAAARAGVHAHQLAERLVRAPAMLERIRSAVTLEELFREAGAGLTDPAGPGYAGAAFLLASGDQLVLQHSTFPQPGRTFDRDQDHRYARMARGADPPYSDDGECLVPMHHGAEEIGYLILRFGDEQRLLVSEGGELADAQLALARLLAAELGLLCSRLFAGRSDAPRDGTSGLTGRAVFERTLERELQRARRYERPLTVMLVSARAGIDTLADILVDDFRAIDLICRYEQETFAILLPETSLAQAKSKAESLRRLAEADSPIGVGLASRSWATTDWRELVEHGERALAESSRLGGNVVCFWGEKIGRVPRKLATPLD